MHAAGHPEVGGAALQQPHERHALAGRHRHAGHRRPGRAGIAAEIKLPALPAARADEALGVIVLARRLRPMQLGVREAALFVDPQLLQIFASRMTPSEARKPIASSVRSVGEQTIVANSSPSSSNVSGYSAAMSSSRSQATPSAYFGSTRSSSYGAACRHLLPHAAGWPNSNVPLLRDRFLVLARFRLQLRDPLLHVAGILQGVESSACLHHDCRIVFRNAGVGLVNPFGNKTLPSGQYSSRLPEAMEANRSAPPWNVPRPVVDARPLRLP